MGRLGLIVARWPTEENQPIEPALRDRRVRVGRDQIVRAAARHFAERGFAGATVSSIADACGVSRHVLGHHFPEKRALFVAVLDAHRTTTRTGGTDLARSIAEGGIGALRRAVERVGNSDLNDVHLMVSVMSAARVAEHPAQPYLKARHDHDVAEWAEALKNGIGAGFVRPDVDPASAALRLTALIEGFSIQWLIDSDLEPSVRLEQELALLLTPSGIAALHADPPEQSKEHT